MSASLSPSISSLTVTARLALAVLRVDAYLSILLDHPTSVRYQEFSIPLPKTENLWEATEDERRRLQWSEPAGREKAFLSFLVRNALENQFHDQPIYPLTGADYHYVLCSMVSGTWEAAREAHSPSSDELTTRSNPDEGLSAWRRQLCAWRDIAEKGTQ